MELHGRSGVGPTGVSPLSYETIAHWKALTGADPSWDDVRALMEIDRVLLSKGEEPEAEAAKEQPKTPAWPKKKKKVANDGG